MEGILALSSLDLLGTAGLGLLVSKNLGAGSLAGLGGNDLVGTVGLGEGVESLHHVAVLERVLLGLIVEADALLEVVELGLNLVRVDNSGEIGAIHGSALELVSTLLLTLLGVGAE